MHIPWKFFESTFNFHADSDILSEAYVKTTFPWECVPEKIPGLAPWALRSQRYSIKKEVFEEKMKKIQLLKKWVYIIYDSVDVESM